MATTPIDLKGLNTGSAVSAPGALSSTNLSNTSPLLPSSNLSDLSGLGGFDTDPAFSGTPSLSGLDLSALNNPVDVGTLNVGAPNANLPTDPSTGQPPSTSTGSQGLLSSLGSLIPSASTLAGLAPTAAAGAIGLSQAKDAQKQNQALAAQLAALGGPYTAAGQKLLAQWQSGQITPAQQNVVSTLNSQGKTLMDSAAPLSAIAQTAYQNYQSGTLPPADEQRLNDQVAAQKQQVAQQLASAGITDSTILAGQNAQIDNQAKITRQQLLDARFATGNQAYDQWLSATTQGQALQAEASKFAASSLDTMLQQSLGLSSEGMQPIEESIQLQIQSNAALSAQVNQLMGNLASAYAYQVTGGQPPGGAQGGGGTGGGIAGGIAGLLKGFGGGAGGSGGPSAGSITATDIAGLDYGNSATEQGAIDATAPTLDPNTISGLESTLDPNFGDPSSAGGEAASPDLGALAANASAPGLDSSTVSGLASTSSPSSGPDLASLGAAAGTAASAFGIYQGATSGKPVGEARAAVGATQLAGKAGLVSPQVNAAAGDLGNVLGIYSGIKQGGVAGYTGAGVNAVQLGANVGAFGSASGALGSAAGYVAAPLDLYNEIKTWKSGATGSDALSGAETGAAVGSLIVPGIGTAIGAVIGGIAGAVSSLFGSGKPGKAAGSWDQLTKSNALKSTPGSAFTQQSWAEAFKGMLDEGNNIFKGGGADRHKDPDALAKPLEAQIKTGMAKLGPGATTDQVYNQVIVPWMQSKDSGLNWSVLKNEPQQQLMIKSAVDRVLAGQPIVRAEMTGPT